MIKKNTKDIRGYQKTAEEYKFCSFGIYAGKTQKKHDILDPHVILSYFSNKITLAKSHYFRIVKSRLLHLREISLIKKSLHMLVLNSESVVIIYTLNITGIPVSLEHFVSILCVVSEI